MLWSTRPSEIEPDAATPELPGDEPPAVVSLPANRWLSARVRVGKVVRIQARPWTRRVTAIQPV
ncbi:hypothetical protein GCM10022223_36820 [Kineosporia mesophila]|uniref:Uncharacterized protein n=1 Tax=Kineosporia mesophila TaxID=566012 RepID=A0ABP6ZRK7_9ACTN|nr:hypothetical protein [Kineosporia mesophila]MCD5349892.1 hypothetical protein [Kineosporia mesophila]